MPVGHPRVAVRVHRGCDGPRFIAKKKKAALSKPQKEDPSKESRDLSQGQYGRQRPRPAEPTRRPSTNRQETRVIPLPAAHPACTKEFALPVQPCDNSTIARITGEVRQKLSPA